MEGRQHPDERQGATYGRGPDAPPVDRRLPQLNVAADPERMQEVLQHRLSSLAGSDYKVLECQLTHMFHQEGQRCVLHYVLRLREAATGGELSQRITGTIYAGGKTERIWKSLRRRARRSASSLPFEPVSYDPELDMLLQTFPYDYRLPTLSRLIDRLPPKVDLFFHAPLGQGDWRTESSEVELVRYWAGKGATLRLTAQVRDTATDLTKRRNFYAKVYPNKKQGEYAYHVLQRLCEGQREGHRVGGERFTMARPGAWLPGLRLLLQEEVPGLSIEELLLSGKDVIPTVRRAARALVAFHESHYAIRACRRDARDEIARVEKAGKLLRSVSGLLEAEIEEIVGTIASDLNETPLVLVHGDLKPDHILVGDHLGLIDLDNLVVADPVTDVARFAATVIEMSLRSAVPHDHTQAAAQTFIEEYFAHAPEAWRERLPLHYAGALLRRAATLYRHRVPDWPEKAEVLVRRSKGALTGKLW